MGRHPPPLSGGVADARLGAERHVLRHREFERPDVIRAIGGVKQTLPPVGAYLLRSDSAKLPVSPVDELVSAARVRYPHRRRATVRHDPEALFAVPRGFLGAFSLRDIFDMHHGIQGVAGGI